MHYVNQPLLLFAISFLTAATEAADVRDDSDEFLDNDIPKDWRDYVPKDMLKIWPVKDTSDGLLQGDIAGIDPSLITGDVLQATAVSDENLLWPGGMVPYEMSRSLSSFQFKFVKQALEDIASKTCVRFVPRKYEDDYLFVVSGSSCHSMIGKQGSKQEISMHQGCHDGLGATQHEFMHALGFFHEHARPDREEYIFINGKNIEGDQQTLAQFKAKTASAVNTLETPYDYDSVMHYGWNAFSRNRNFPTILPKQKDKRIGQREKLSEIDVLRINRLYKCKDYLKKNAPPPANISTISYDEDLQNWAILCDGIVQMEGGWDENPDVCLKLCDKIDTEQYENKWIGARDRYSGKTLFNDPKSKRCMTKKWLCDGVGAVGKDKSLQDKETCQKFCKGGGYVSISPSQQCVHFSELCNGKIANKGSGGDGSDEIKENCISLCQNIDEQENAGSLIPESRLFNLEPSGRCMIKTWLCDGISHGKGNPTGDPEVCKKYCTGGGYFPTSDTSQCIHYTWLCDGRNDTASGWDEKKENCLEICPKVSGFEGDLFNMDKTSQCIHKRQLCTGHKDTGDPKTNDVAVCEKYCTGNLYFPTPDSMQCLRANDLCNGKKDLENGWDETPKNCITYCRRMNTAKNLQVNPRTKRCSVRQE